MTKHRGQKLKMLSAKGAGDSSGMEEKVDAWLVKLSGEVSRACDKFWTTTDERRSVDGQYRRNNPFINE
jgi:hypothetical protein